MTSNLPPNPVRLTDPNPGGPSNEAQSLPYDSILLVSFGGPEAMEDVLPFLENVLKGKNVPRERMLEVVEHYRHFGGKSPINDQCRELLDAIQTECKARGIQLPIYWGNRNWHPLIPDTLREMHSKGHRRAIAFFTSMFSCYSGCRQYRENIADAQASLDYQAPTVEKVRKGFNHPKFISAQASRLRESLSKFASGIQQQVKVLFCAHSIPQPMADHSRYESQLREACRLVSESVGQSNWELVFQSRSGPPQQPWLEPDVCDRIRELHETESMTHVVLVPIGFISDHMEVLFDLDEQAAELANELGIEFQRAGTVGVHPDFVSMIVDLFQERITGITDRPYVGCMGPSHDVCPSDCCLYPRTPRDRPV